MIQLNNIIYKMFTSIFNYLFNLTANFNSSSLYLDAPEPWQIGFQDPASPGFEGIIALHDSILFYLVLISVSVFWLIFSLIRHFSSTKTGIIHKYLNHSTVLELIWTVSPAFILVAIAFPSFKLLYTLDEVIDPALTVKVTGHHHLDSLFFNYCLLLIYNFDFIYYSNYFEIIIKLFIYLVYSLPVYNYTTDHLILFSTFTGFIKIFNIRHFGNDPKSNVPIRSNQRIGPHDYDVLCIIFGSMLGDGYANLRTQNYGNTVRFSFKQSFVHKDYLFYLYKFFLLRGYCSNLEPRIYTRRIKGYNKIYQGYEFMTYSFTSLVWIYNAFYNDGIKTVPSILRSYMTPLTLAIWISDDGGWAGSGVRIATHSFPFDEVNFLINLLKEKFDLNCTIQLINSGKYQIYIKSDSIKSLRDLILPFLHPSMHYKLGL